MTEQNNVTIPFEDAGLAHHMLVGKAPQDSGPAYCFAVAAGNKLVNAGVAISLGVSALVSKKPLTMDLD